MKYLFLGIVVITISWEVAAQDSLVTLSLKQSCMMAMEKNTGLINAALDQQKTSLQLKEVQGKLYPQIEGYSNFNYYYSIPQMILPGEIFGQTGLIPVQIGTKYDWSSGFKATQILYNQSYLTSLKLAKKMSEMSELSLQQRKEELVYQVSQVYYLCKTTQSQITQLENTMLNTNRMLEIAKLQNENGIIRKVDYSRILVTRNNLQTQIDNLQQLYQQQMNLIKYLIGIDVKTNVKLTDSISYIPKELSEEIPDFNKRTELKILTEQMEIASLNQRYDRQSYLPSLSAIGQYYYQGQRNEFDFFKGGNDKFFKVGFLGLNLSVPIFGGFTKQSKMRLHAIELMQLQNTKKDTEEHFSKEYRDAVMQYNMSLNALLRQRENSKIAEETYEASLQGYRQQVVPLSDLLMSDNSLTETRLSILNALMQLKNAELEVKKAKGEILHFD